VVNANGVGVAGVDIDFVSLGSGGNPNELNDGTDANGNFLTTVDPGIYEIRFFPPSPPASSLLAAKRTPVVVSGTVNLGTITLAAGFSLQGTVRNELAQPVADVKLDVYDAGTGQLVLINNARTNAFGTFNIAVPKDTPLRAEFLTADVIGQVLVPIEVFGTVSAPTNMGIVPLQTGFHVTGTVLRENGLPAFGADVDAVDAATDETLFTPSDNVNAFGTFDLVLPAGTFDLDVSRPTGQTLVGVEVNNLNVAAPADVGILTMRNGVFLSGHVVDELFLPVEAADVNVIEAATGLPIALGGDNTNAAGFYSVVVPTGTMHVVFSPPGPHTAFAKDRHRDVAVLANTTLHGRFAEKLYTFGPRDNPTMSGPILLPFGSGTSGSGHSVPHLQGHVAPAGSTPAAPSATPPGAPTADASPTVTLRLFGGLPGARAELRLGREARARAATPTQHLVRPAMRIPVQLDADGSAALSLSLDELAPAGTQTFAQFLVLDRGARRGFALSQVLSLESAR
jgi:hypothetical protein